MKTSSAFASRRLNLLRLAVLALTAALPLPSWAAAESRKPDDLVRSVAQDVLQVAREHRDDTGVDRAAVERIIEEKIAPYFDFNRITRLATGPDWRQASKEQRERLVTAFRRMLVRTYSAAYRGYRDIVIDVKPADVASGDKEALVRTTVKLPKNPQPLPIDYSMLLTPEGWKVYDVAVEGVSLVTTYRSSFRERIRTDGIDGLIDFLENGQGTLPKTR